MVNYSFRKGPVHSYDIYIFVQNKLILRTPSLNYYFEMLMIFHIEKQCHMVNGYAI